MTYKSILLAAVVVITAFNQGLHGKTPPAYLAVDGLLANPRSTEFLIGKAGVEIGKSITAEDWIEVGFSFGSYKSVISTLALYPSGKEVTLYEHNTCREIPISWVRLIKGGRYFNSYYSTGILLRFLRSASRDYISNGEKFNREIPADISFLPALKFELFTVLNLSFLRIPRHSMFMLFKTLSFKLGPSFELPLLATASEQDLNRLQLGVSGAIRFNFYSP